VISQTPELRKAKLGKVIGALERISVGDEAAGDFEDWCLRSIQIIFAAQLTNIELHPNRGAVQRRDIVATNLGRSEGSGDESWKTIRHVNLYLRSRTIRILGRMNTGKWRLTSVMSTDD
jgi:hypothetical protein